MASIQKRPNGKWRGRYRDEADKEHARHFDRKVDAQKWLDEVTASVVTGAYVDPNAGKLTFDAWFREWSELQVWESMTRVQADLVRRSVTFGQVPLSNLRESHLQAWVRSMQTDGLATNTIHTRMMPVKSALRAAVRDRRLARDPSVGVVLPRKVNRSQTLEVATADEVAALVTASREDMRAYLALCAFAGLRLGEASAMNVDVIDFLRRQADIKRQVQKVRGASSEVRAPKYGSYRTAYLPDELVDILARHVELYLDADGWLFTRAPGVPIAPSSVNAWWLSTKKRAGITRPLTLHSLRHFFASGLIAEGCDVVTVQRALGHKTPAVTLNTYSHLWPNAEDKTRSAASALASAVLTSGSADSLRTEGVL